MRGVSGDDPEGGAGGGVPRLRLVTARPGRLGTPPARHYDLAARSSLHGSGGNAGDGSAAPGLKSPRWSAAGGRREVGVPPLRDVGRFASAPACYVIAGQPGAAAPGRLSALRPPLDRG